MNRRNIADDSVLIDTYHTLAYMTDEDGNKLFTDVEIAEKLGVSPRQISKAKEVELKANAEIKDALKNGEISLHKAYTTMKEEKKIEISTPKPLEVQSESELPVQEEEEIQNISDPAEETTSETGVVTVEATIETPAIKEESTAPVAESLPKPKKPSAEKPQVEKLSLKFKPEDFTLIQNAAQAANVSVTEYAMNIILSSIQAVTEAETVSEKETA